MTTNREEYRGAVRFGGPNGNLRPLRIFVPHASDNLTDYAPHGDGLVAFEVVSRLAARGHEVVVASPKISVRGRIPASLRLNEITVPKRALSRARLSYMVQVRRLYERLRRERMFDVVHQLNPVFAGISLALLGSRTPVVLGAYVGAWPANADVHGFMGEMRLPFNDRLRHTIAWLQQRQAAAIIVTTPVAEKLIVDRSANASKIVHIPHGIDPDVFSVGPATRAPGDAPIILFLGGTERRKGIQTLLNAFEIVHAEMPAVRLVVGGDGGRLGEVRSIVSSMPAASHIELLGEVDRDKVPGLVRSAEIFCLPSNGEPFGMALLEAMACGRPVVVTDVGGPRYIVDDRGGEKVPVGDAVALAAALLRLLRSPERRRAMGEHNRSVVESRYTWDHVIDRLEETYAGAIERSRKRS